jgi:hypothetical protein
MKTILMARIKLYPYLPRFLPDLGETGLKTSACNAVKHFEFRENWLRGGCVYVCLSGIT